MLIDRIKEFAKNKGISIRKLSEIIGFNYTTLNGYSTGSRKTIDASLLEKIASSFEDINCNWLLTGRGSMLKGIEQGTFNEQRINGDSNNMVGGGTTIAIHNDTDYLNEIIKEYKDRLKKQDEYIQELLLEKKELRQQMGKLIEKL